MPYSHIFSSPASVEQEEREGRDVAAPSLHRRKPEAGPVPGGPGEALNELRVCPATLT